MQTQPNYFIFDLDGTLFDTSLDLANSVNFALAKHGFPTHTIPQIVSFIGNGSLQLLRRSIPTDQEGILPEVHQAFLNHYLKNCTIDTKPYPGVLEFLETNARASILTNKPHAPTIRILEHFGLQTRFDFVLCGDTAPARKPEPDGLKLILTEVGVSPSEALMVGDDLPDIGVAKALGVPSLILLTGFGEEDALRSANPSFIARDFLSFVQQVRP